MNGLGIKNKGLITRFDNEKYSLYSLALGKYNRIFGRYNLVIGRDDKGYKLLREDNKDTRDFWKIYDELEEQSKIIEYVLIKNGVIKEGEE